MTKILIPLICFFIVSSWNLYGSDKAYSWCVYRPAYFETSSKFGSIVLGREKLSPSIKEGVLKAFKYYNKSVMVDGEKLLINCRAYNDFEALVNYTKKATDKRWLNTHN